MAMNRTFDAAEAEDRLYRAWDEAGCFKAGANATRAETMEIVEMVLSGLVNNRIVQAINLGHNYFCF